MYILYITTVQWNDQAEEPNDRYKLYNINLIENEC